MPRKHKKERIVLVRIDCGERERERHSMRLLMKLKKKKKNSRRKYQVVKSFLRAKRADKASTNRFQ